MRLSWVGARAEAEGTAALQQFDVVNERSPFLADAGNAVESAPLRLDFKAFYM
jgi:hypothetical protein